MEKLKEIGKKVGSFLLAITWCAVQTVIGCLFALCLLPTSRVHRYRGVILVYHPYARTFSLGTFAFVSDRVPMPREARGRMHGYYLLSLICGPFLFFVLSLPQLFVRIPAVKRYRAERDLTERDIFAERKAEELEGRFGRD